MSLYAHQRAGAAWIGSRRRSFLADAPGLGKTRTILASLPEGARPLIFAPAAVLTHWKRENAEVRGARPIHILSYDQFVRSESAQESARIYAATHIVADEAHRLAYTKSARTRLLLGRTGMLRNPGVCAILASGTPFTKHPGQLWPMLASLWPEKLRALDVRTYEQFLDRFTIWYHTKWGIKVVRANDEGAAILRDLMFGEPGAMMLRREAAKEKLLWSRLLLDPAERAIPHVRESEVASMVDALESEDAGALEQHADFVAARHALGVRKASVAGMRLVEELENNAMEKVVVGYYHRAVGDALEKMLRGFGVAKIDGRVTGGARDVAIDRFQQDIDTRVILVQTTAGSEGITLTAAHHVVIVEPALSAQTNLQLAKRVDRIGQHALTCFARFFSLADSPLDEALLKLHDREMKMFAGAFTQ